MYKISAFTCKSAKVIVDLVRMEAACFSLERQSACQAALMVHSKMIRELFAKNAVLLVETVRKLQLIVLLVG